MKSDSVLVAVCLILLLALPQAWADLAGDIDENRNVEVADAIIVLQLMVGIPQPVTADPQLEPTGDGKWDILDAVYILQKVAGKRNVAPVLRTIGAQTVAEHAPLALTISADDEDNDDLVLSVTNLPDGASFDPATGAFFWQPYYDQSGQHVITFSATDIYGASDAEAVIVMVTDTVPLFDALRYFPLNVGDWHRYRDDITGLIKQSDVTGERSIGGTVTKIVQYAEGDREYYTSDTNGIQLYGIYIISPEYTGDLIFSSPIQYLQHNAPLGTTKGSDTTYSFWVGQMQFNVDLTTTCSFLAVEDVVTENRTLKDCFKVSVQISQYVRELDLWDISPTIYYWFYEGVGPVRQVEATESDTITQSFVGGDLQNY